MKKILNKINLNKISFSNAENIKDNMTNLIPYFLPENWSSYKKTYILFWSIASFTIIFFINESSLHQNHEVLRYHWIKPRNTTKPSGY